MLCVCLLTVCWNLLYINCLLWDIGSAASRCGLKKGDVLIKINKISINNESITQANDLLQEVRFNFYLFIYLFVCLFIFRLYLMVKSSLIFIDQIN